MTDGKGAIDHLIDEIARYLGGLGHAESDAVKGHIDVVPRQSIRSIARQRVDACRHLGNALSAMDHHGTAQAIRAADPYLSWVTYDAYGEEAIGSAFARGHAFASLIGEGAFYEAQDFEVGLFLIAPQIFYRDHRHLAPELYVPLTGPHGWRFKPGDTLKWLPAHHPIWNQPWQPHATMTGSDPFLCVFAWTQDVASPAQIICADDWEMLERNEKV